MLHQWTCLLSFHFSLFSYFSTSGRHSLFSHSLLLQFSYYQQMFPRYSFLLPISQIISIVSTFITLVTLVRCLPLLTSQIVYFSIGWRTKTCSTITNTKFAKRDMLGFTRCLMHYLQLLWKF